MLIYAILAKKNWRERDSAIIVPSSGFSAAGVVSERLQGGFLMKRLLHIAASPRYGRSHSRAMGKYFIERLAARHAGIEIDTLDLARYELPHLTEDFTNARYKLPRGQELDAAERTVWSRIEAEVERFRAADLYLLSTPMWNFGLPGVVKRYIDTITQPGMLFDYTEAGLTGLMRGKTMVLLYASGSTYATPETAPLDGVAAYAKNWTLVTGLRILPVNFGSQDIPADHEAIAAATRARLDAIAAEL